ncbi:hypothetical protein LPB136_09490 [Tenacibaculum todarodis]|uniref:Uncharacterized protein n=1 Tax=Tenacibaculum todarodis TaxID=1850252 RepID=A0A1L3JKD6_9FLAO|nr:hypothetical protein [Tenacibaculum todarodis]APG65579.1 hypothetical protein LPB136_09490 [Tenacibaculum todarodis]
MKKITRFYRILILFIILFGTSLFLWNCEDDNSVIEKEEIGHHDGKQPNEVSLDFFKNTTKIFNLKKHLKNRRREVENNTMERNETYRFEDFEIDTTLVKQLVIESDNSSFSFKINLKENIVENETYNLLIRKIENEWVSTIFLFVKNNDTSIPKIFSSIEEVYSENGVPDNLQSRWVHYFGEVTTYHCTYGGVGQACYQGCDGCPEYCATTTMTYETIFVDDGAGSSYTNSSNIGYYNPGEGNGTQNPACEASTQGDLDGDCAIQPYEECLRDSEIININSYNNLTPRNRTAIRNFISQNGCSTDTQNFAELAIEALDNDGVDDGEVDFEDRIINELIGSAKCIFKRLKTLSLFKGTIKKFENSDYDLIISYRPCSSGASQCTSDEFIDIGIIEMKFPGGLNSSYLDFAATILHEGIHAELYKYVQERNNGVDVNDRPNLMYHYFNLKATVDPMFLDATVQHEHMADKYVKPVAEAIRELDGNRYPLDYYWGFAWDGLRPYGINHYLDSNSGNYIPLNDAGFSQKQALVNSTSPFNTQTFNQNCN